MEVSHSTILLSFSFLLFLPSSEPVSDISTLVYKTCATQTFNDQLSQSYSQTLNYLFQQLTSQSSQHKFFKTAETVNDDTAISGLFQCRDDINNEDCFSCVNLLPQMSNTLCSDSTSARVQLDGCYIQYGTEELPEETSGESKTSTLLHKDCGEPVLAFFKFNKLMDEAFVNLESGILNSNGYYATNYKSVKLMAQCEGDSDTCECSNCVSDAVQVAKEDCRSSLSAQIYLDKCFISYIYQPELGAIPGNSIPGASGSNNANKLAAIFVGGAAALVLAFIFLSLINARLKKADYE
ncbi:cysteine-rich repeat secretory protein 11-like [Abrus precatorius]|uniref:Cysteine-rich repeat secretory protein 11-like n=1 Tax=Abrus precatorius TaxID=3816 RepID=A0A8B8M796_ABRPR|nr:cysteine-rich repeat secretory protein 11-like [Abrus precatorius]